MVQYHGEKNFNALITAINEYGEIRYQHFAVTDRHEKFESQLAAFEKTTELYGQPRLQLLHTDDPKKDRKYFQSKLPSLVLSEKKMNEVERGHDDCDHDNSEIPVCDVDVNQFSIASDATGIGNLMDAFRGTIVDDNDEKVFVGFDIECDTYRNAYGRINGFRKAATCQVAYELQNGAVKNVKSMILQIHSFTSLPQRFIEFLSDTRIHYVGVGVSTDLKKLQREFPNCRESIDDILNSNRYINLAKYARQRDVVSNSYVGLEKLVEVCLQLGRQ